MPHRKKKTQTEDKPLKTFRLFVVPSQFCRPFRLQNILRVTSTYFSAHFEQSLLKGLMKQQNVVLCAWVGLCLFVLNGKWEHLWTVKSHGRSADSTQTEENKYNGRLQLYPHHSARSQQPFSHEQMERTEMSYFQHLFTLIFCSFNDMILHDPPLESLSRHSSELRLGSGTKKTLG